MEGTLGHLRREGPSNHPTGQTDCEGLCCPCDLIFIRPESVLSSWDSLTTPGQVSFSLKISTEKASRSPLFSPLWVMAPFLLRVLWQSLHTVEWLALVRHSSKYSS